MYVQLGGCQNYDPFWGTLDLRCRSIIGIKKGAIILTITQLKFQLKLSQERSSLSLHEPPGSLASDSKLRDHEQQTPVDGFHLGFRV